MQRLILFIVLLAGIGRLEARPLMDLVDVQGLRQNQLIGYGLVVGLNGTGDRNQVKFTSQSMTNMLKQFGVQLADNIDPKLRNVAAVTVHANLSSVASIGQAVDVTVSSIGDASSLQGGALLLTPLHGVDGEIYAIAQGSLVVGGLSAQGRDGSSVRVNIPTVGTIPSGAIIEQEVPAPALPTNELTLTLKAPHYRTARNVEVALNRLFGAGVASAQDAGRIRLRVPAQADQKVVFMSMLEDVSVDEGRTRPRVVYNSRTGSLVMGQGVRVRKAAVTHGNLTVTISENMTVSQPPPSIGGQGRTVVTPNSQVRVSEDRPNMFIWPEGTDLETIVQAVNSLGATPSDIMSMLQALEEAGALEGELVVI